MKSLQELDMLPEFRLKSVDGRDVGGWDFKERQNLVIAFFRPDCVSCSDFLINLADSYADYSELQAEIIAIGEGSLDEIREFAASKKLPFVVLADPAGRALSKFADRTPAIFVSDRFGQLRLIEYEEDAAHFPAQEQILTQLELIELECPECGVSTWD